MARSAVVTLLLGLVVTGHALAQSTGLPSFNAPYRAFVRYEFGGTVSFPDGGGTALEGQYRFGSGQFDIGLRGGVFFTPAGAGDDVVLLGVSARQRVIEHSEEFPLDGAIVLGVGGLLVENFSSIIIPFGLSLGRRLDVEDSPVSIVPFAQPTAFLSAGSNQDTDLNFSLGFGADVRLSRVFDARLSIGLGDIEGISISAVWVR
jgi:hypothetical protein